MLIGRIWSVVGHPERHSLRKPAFFLTFQPSSQLSNSQSDYYWHFRGLDAPDFALVPASVLRITHFQLE